MMSFRRLAMDVGQWWYQHRRGEAAALCAPGSWRRGPLSLGADEVSPLLARKVSAPAVPTAIWLAPVLLIGCMMTDVLAQAPGGNRVSTIFQNQLSLVEHDVVSLAEAMPADTYGFRPANGEFAGVRTFGEQVKHIATMIYMTSAIVLDEKSPYGPGINDNGPDDITGKDAIVAYLKASIAYARTAMASLNEQNALEPLTTYFGLQPRAEVASGIAYHSYDHYGQMVVYARMNGIVPPASRR
jgi:hypothetical protein